VGEASERTHKVVQSVGGDSQLENDLLEVASGKPEPPYLERLSKSHNDLPKFIPLRDQGILIGRNIANVSTGLMKIDTIDSKVEKGRISRSHLEIHLVNHTSEEGVSITFHVLGANGITFNGVPKAKGSSFEITKGDDVSQSMMDATLGLAADVEYAVVLFSEEFRERQREELMKIHVFEEATKKPLGYVKMTSEAMSLVSLRKAIDKIICPSSPFKFLQKQFGVYIPIASIQEKEHKCEAFRPSKDRPAQVYLQFSEVMTQPCPVAAPTSQIAPPATIITEAENIEKRRQEPSHPAVTETLASNVLTSPAASVTPPAETNKKKRTNKGKDEASKKSNKKRKKMTGYSMWQDSVKDEYHEAKEIAQIAGETISWTTFTSGKWKYVSDKEKTAWKKMSDKENSKEATSIRPSSVAAVDVKPDGLLEMEMIDEVAQHVQQSSNTVASKPKKASKSCNNGVKRRDEAKVTKEPRGVDRAIIAAKEEENQPPLKKNPWNKRRNAAKVVKHPAKVPDFGYDEDESQCMSQEY